MNLVDRIESLINKYVVDISDEKKKEYKEDLKEIIVEVVSESIAKTIEKKTGDA